MVFLLVEGAVASWLVRSPPNLAVRYRVLTGDITLCSRVRHFVLAVPLSTRVYKWVPANLMLGLTMRWTSIPSKRKWKEFQSLHATETGDMRQTDEPLGPYPDLTFTMV